MIGWRGVRDVKAFYSSLNYAYQNLIKSFFASEGNRHGDFKPVSTPSLTSTPRVNIQPLAGRLPTNPPGESIHAGRTERGGWHTVISGLERVADFRVFLRDGDLSTRWVV